MGLRVGAQIRLNFGVNSNERSAPLSSTGMLYHRYHKHPRPVRGVDLAGGRR